MRAVRKGLLRRREGGGFEQAGLQALRQAGEGEGRAGDFLHGQAAIGARDREAAVREADVGLGRLEQVRGDAPALGDHLVGGEPERRAADHRGARAGAALAEGDRVGVAVDHAQVLGREAEPLVRDLPVHGLVSLALVLGADHERRAAARLEADLGVLDAGRRRALDRVGQADAAKLAVRF